MRLAERILAIAFFAGVILKLLMVKAGDEIALFSMLILACIYYPLGFLFFNQIRLRNVFKKNAYEHVTTGKIVIAVFVGIAQSIVCIGILFKLLILPGADEMLMIGVVSTFFLSLVVATLSSLNRKFILIRTGLIGVMGGILFFTSQLSIVKLQYRNHPAYVEAYVKYWEDPRNEVYKNKFDLEYQRVWMSEEEFKEYEKFSGD